MLEVMLINLGIVLLLMVLLWMISLLLKDASIVDPFWGLGFVVIAGSTMLWTADAGLRSWLLLALVGLWGIRLSAYLLWRNAGKGEDRRYAAMRAKHGSRFWWVSLGTVFLLQGMIMWFVAFPVQAGILSAGEEIWFLDILGLAFWSAGLFFESVGDYQMARFKSNPNNQGKVMKDGLWRFTRHPNYFGDFCVWWGLYLVAAAGGAWWTVLSPIMMSIFLMKVSGVTLLESDIEERRPAYRQYKLETNAFFPGPARVASSPVSN